MGGGFVLLEDGERLDHLGSAAEVLDRVGSGGVVIEDEDLAIGDEEIRLLLRKAPVGAVGPAVDQVADRARVFAGT
jgi:hypothetical protein